MKHFIVLFFVLFSIVAISQDKANYYWSGGRKISLTPDSTSWSLIPSKSSSKTTVSSKISSDAAVSNLRLSEGSELIDFTLKEYSQKTIKQLKQKLVGQGEITCHHLVQGKTPIIVTGEILLQPKKSVAIDAVLDLIKYKAKQVKATAYNTFVLKADNIKETIKIANQIYESGLVDWCHPDFWAEIQRTTADPLYNQQYYLNQASNIDINAPEAFAITQGCSNIRVAVIDDGVENHEDINGRVLQGFTARNVTGFGAPVANLPPVDLLRIGHGQACSGIIGATQDNNLGIGGIAPNSRIIPVNIFSDWFPFVDASGQQRIGFRETPQEIAASIDFAWDPLRGNADVISNSWGFNSTAGPIDADAIRQAITNARTQGRNRNGAARGCIVVFASGNSNPTATCPDGFGCFNGVSFPANVEGVITVGAIDRNGNIWNYSSRGTEMDLVAPTGNVNNAGDVTTTDRQGANGYNLGNYVGNFGGTSAACPQVSGVAALMISVNPNLTEAQVRTILQQTATDMGGTGFDNTFGFGRLNAEAALRRIIIDLGFSLTGSNLICTNSSSQFTLNNPPAGSTVTWSSSNPSGISFNPVSGNSTTPSRLNNFNGQVTITATINSGCGIVNVARNVWVGDPAITYNPPGRNPCMNNPWYSGPLFPGLAYSWSVDNANVWFTNAITNYSAAVISYNPEYFNITLIISDGICTTSTTIFSYTAGYYCQCFSDPACNGGFARFNVSPNPANNQLVISFEETEYEQELKKFSKVNYSVALIDEQGTVVSKVEASSQIYKWDTSKLPVGTYYLKISYKDFIETKRVLISH